MKIFRGILKRSNFNFISSTQSKKKTLEEKKRSEYKLEDTQRRVTK
jgi:hypothetical protein